MLHQRLISLWPNLKGVLQDGMEQHHLIKRSCYDTVYSEESCKLQECAVKATRRWPFDFLQGSMRGHMHRQPEEGSELGGSMVCRWHYSIQSSENKGLQKEMMRLSKWAINQQIKFNVAKSEVMFMAGKMFWTSHLKLWTLGSLRGKIFEFYETSVHCSVVVE